MISKRFALQRVFDMRVKGVSTDKLTVQLNDLSECNLETNEELVYSSGGAGNSYITSHSHSKRLTGTAMAATFYNDMMGLILGKDVLTGETTLPWVDTITVTDDEAITTYTAIGEEGSEIKSLYIYNADGSFGQEYTQDALVEAEKFTYTPGTKTLTFNTGDIANGTIIIVDYDVTSGSSTHTLTSDVDKFSKIVKIELISLVQDACTGVEYPAIITVPRAKLQGEVSLSTSAAGDPAMMNVSFEGLKASCVDNRLWDMKIFDTEELS